MFLVDYVILFPIWSNFRVLGVSFFLRLFVLSGVNQWSLVVCLCALLPPKFTIRKGMKIGEVPV